MYERTPNRRSELSLGTPMLEDFRVKQGGKDGECTSNFTVRVLPSCFLETTIVIQERHPKMQVRGDPLNTPAVSKVEIRAECGAASEQWNPRSLRSWTAHLKDMFMTLPARNCSGSGRGILVTRRSQKMALPKITHRDGEGE